jgi:UDP-glucose 4-epimerase
VRLFVTGGAGYVGSVVCEHLLQQGHEVTVFDDLSTGHRAAVPAAAQFVGGDLRDAAALGAALPAGCDAVLHFASRSIVADSMRDPIGYWEHNVGGATVLLRVLAGRGVRRVVFSSSAAVYGDPEAQPIPEDAPPRPLHPYGSSKRAIEMLLEDAARSIGLASIQLRYFNAAGASAACGEDHRPETHLVPRLLDAALADDAPAVPIYGDDWPTPDGTCIRDYIHVEDLAAAHARALEGLSQGVHGAVNLGSGRGHSVREILDCVRRVTGRNLPVRVEPRRPGDPARLVAGVERAARELGWRAGRDLDAVVTSAWNWRQRHPQGYVDGVGRRGADPSLA